MRTTNPTLNTVKAAQNLEDLKPCITFLCDEMQLMTWGEFTAFRRTIEVKAAELGISLKTVNEIATAYQGGA